MIVLNVKNEFGGRFIDIVLETIVVAAASVVEVPSRCSKRAVKSVNVYKTSAGIMFVRGPGGALAL